MTQSLLLCTVDGSLFAADSNAAETLPTDAASNRRPYEKEEEDEQSGRGRTEGCSPQDGRLLFQAAGGLPNHGHQSHRAA